MKAIVQRAQQLDLDVLALQEVWSRRAALALVEFGAESGYRPLWAAGRFSGGLMALSRLETKSAAFHEFAVRGLPQRIQHGDYYGRKGYALARLESNGGPFWLLVTHLHARYAGPGQHDEYLGIRAAQIAELADCIAGLEPPLIAVGDFNTREGEPEHECLLGLTGLMDAAAVLDKRQPTVLATNPFVGAGHLPQERIDYVFVDGALVVTEIRREFDQPLEIDSRTIAFSDHAGLVATVAVEGGPAQQHRVELEVAERLNRLIVRGQREALGRRTRHRLTAAGLLAGAGLGRRLGARGLAVGLLGAAIGETLLAERFVAEELRGFEHARAVLDRLAG